MNLIIFDCDDTLWKLPYEENDEFMSKKESIYKYDFIYKYDILKILKEKKSDKNNILILLTNRFVDTADEIKYRLFQDKNISFDYSLFRDKDRDKSNRLDKLINKLKKDNILIEKIEFYDDKEKHLNSMKKLINKYKQISFKLIKVTN